MKKIPLTQGMWAVVDDEDYDALAAHKWCYNNGYAVRTTKHKGVVNRMFMHRVVNNTPKGLVTDHINRDKLDNRKCNLRAATRQVNAHNTGTSTNNASGYRGVSFYKITGRWRAMTSSSGKSKHIGYFSSPEEAAKAYLAYLEQNKLL